MMVVSWSSMYWSIASFSVYWSWSRVHWMSRFFYNSVEPTVIISGVVNSSEGTIRFGNGVGTFNYIAVTDFVLGFVVTGVGVLNSIVEFVFGVSLKARKYSRTTFNFHFRFEKSYNLSEQPNFKLKNHSFLNLHSSLHVEQP